MDVKKLLILLGNPGRYAKVLFCLLCLNHLPVTFNHLAMSIYGAVPEHICNVPTDYADNNDSIPLTEDGKHESCEVYVNYTSQSGSRMACPEGWNYTLLPGPPEEATVVDEWDLVCDRRYMTGLSTTIYFTGVMIGGVCFGAVSDAIGRRPTILITLYMPVLLGIMLYFVESFILFNIIRFIIGVLIQGLQTSSYVLAMELFATSQHRSYQAAMMESSWALGVMILAGLAYLLRSWRYIQLGISLSTVLALTYTWLLPESLNWLLSKQKYSLAEKQLNMAAKFNKVQLPHDPLELENKDTTDPFVQHTTKSYTIVDMFRTPKLRARSLILFYVWFSAALAYYGLSFQASKLSGNKYLNFFISGAVELPAYLAGLWILNRFGRRRPLSIYFLLGGAVCIVAGVIPTETGDGKDISAASTALAWFGKFGIAGVWSVIFLYASEVYPTVIRNVGVGACAFCARVGSLISPQLLTLGDYTYTWVPILIIGIVSVIAGFVALLLPETLNQHLPETVSEAEMIPWFWQKKSLTKANDSNPQSLHDGKFNPGFMLDNPTPQESNDTRF